MTTTHYQPALEIRRRLRGTKSIAQHGRATPQLTSSRQALAAALKTVRAGEIDEAAIRAACAAHDAACREMALPGVPAAGGPLRPEH